MVPVMMVCVIVRGREVVLIPIVIAIMPDTVRLLVVVTPPAPIVVTVHLALVTRPPVRVSSRGPEYFYHDLSRL